MNVVNRCFMGIFCLFTSYLVSLNGADLHCIIVGDTGADDIKNAIQIDMRSVYFEAQRIASYTGMNLKISLYSGGEAKPSPLLQTIQSLQTNRDDAIIFYFSGHGYRLKDKASQWPYLLLLKEQKAINLDLITKALAEKTAHFILVIADCCNNVIQDQFARPVVEKEIKDKSSLTKIKRNYRSLFLESSVLITVTSAGVGQTSLCNSNGSHYTNSFLKALHNEAQVTNRSSNWSNIIERSAFMAREMALRTNHHQDAVYEIVPR